MSTPLVDAPATSGASKLLRLDLLRQFHFDAVDAPVQAKGGMTLEQNRRLASHCIRNVYVMNHRVNCHDAA